MKNDDYGFYGKGIDGYVHYKQSFDEIQKRHPSNPSSPKRESGSHSKDSDDSFDRWFTFFGAIVAFLVILYCIGIYNGV